MSIADRKALRDLEFEKLKRIVSSYSSSTLGAEAIEALLPLSDRGAIERGIDEVGEAIRFLEGGERFSLGGVSDLLPLLERAKEGSLSFGRSRPRGGSGGCSPGRSSPRSQPTPAV